MDLDGRTHLDTHVVVWLARISQAHDSLTSLEAFLADDERVRAARFRFPEDRARFVLGRSLLRKSLRHYLGLSPESIKLTLTPHGRPVLQNGDTIQFSVAHSGDWVGLALTAQGHVGIDLEHTKFDFDPYPLAERIFSEEDLASFLQLPGEEATPTFFRAWTCKEAYLKARGEGIGERLRDASVDLKEEEPCLLSDFRDHSAAQKWSIHTLPLPSDYVGHIAWDGRQKKIDYHRIDFAGSEIILHAHD